MIIGDPSTFAIESSITKAYTRPSLCALGLFVIYVGGHRYGVYKSDATMLACSIDEIAARTANRGKHTATFSAEPDAGKIADAFQDAIYGDQQQECYFGIPLSDFCKLFYDNSSDLKWIPDGDAAFDDGSYVLQFDIVDRVRLIAFKCKEKFRHDPPTLRDIWLSADEYYRILQQWLEAFNNIWTALPKTPE